MTYINPRFVPEDKTSELEKQQNAWKALLLANKRGMPETQSYRDRSTLINQGGVDATLYESRKRAAIQQAYLQRQRQALADQQARQINVRIQGQAYPQQSFPNIPGATGDFGRFIQAIAGQESGGNYNNRNRSSGAMGKYQIMPANLGGSHSGWDYEALGRDVSPSQFMGSPQLQEAIARYKLQQYFSKYGARGAAIAWYAGPGAVGKAGNASQGAYPTINQYANSIMRRMGL